MIEKFAVLELQEILAEEYSKQLDLKEVETIGNQLVNLYEAVLNNNKKCS